MKHISLTLATALTACASNQGTPTIAADEPNPASAFCEKQGGRSEIRTDKDGAQYGVCHLSDGRVVEEWAYFRSHNQ